MNGTLISSAAKLNAEGLLQDTLAASPDRSAQIEALYLATLSRRSTDAEQSQIAQYLDAIGDDKRERN